MRKEKLKILLIEDDPDDVLLLKESLAEADYLNLILVHADRLSSGLIQLAEQDYGMVLLDLNLPDSRGLDTLTRLLGQAPNIPIVVLSGLGDEDTAIQALKLGAQDYLVKGEANGAMIARVLRYAVERKRAEREIRQRTEDLTLINTLNEAVNRGESFEVVLDILAKETKRLFSCNGATVYLLSPDERYLIMTSLILHSLLIEKIEQLIGKPIPQVHIPLKGGSHFQKIIKNCEGIITNDSRVIQQQMLEFFETVSLPAMDRKAVQKFIPQIYKILDIKSVITIPLTSHGKTIGLLDISGPRLFIDDDLKRIQNIGGQVTATILRKRAEEALRESEQRLRSLFETMAEGVILIAPEGQIVQANYAAEQILGLRHSEIENRNYTDPAWEVVRPDGTRMPPEEMAGARAMKERRPVKDIEMGLKRPDGSLTWINVSATPLMGQEGRLEGIVGTFADITERKQAEEEIRRQLNLLAALREIDRAITGSTDMQLALNTILAQTATQLGIDAANILLLDPHTQVLEYYAGRGFRTEALQHTRLQLGDSYACRAALGRQIVHIPDLLTHKTDFLRSPTFSREGFVCYFGVPLLAKGKVKGVLEVFHRSALNPNTGLLDFLETLAGQAAIAIDNANLFADLQRSNLELMQAYDATIEGWSQAMDLRDKETEGHTLRVTELTVWLARAMGMSEDEIVHVRRGALLHDMGKIGIPDSILFKGDKLTDEEWALMKQHPQFAYNMLLPIAYLRPVLDIPYCHHEKWDGTGYPRGLKGKKIPLSARIFAVIDVWDALTSDRPYRPAWSKEKALDYIRQQAGMHFDPQITDAFFRMVSDE